MLTGKTRLRVARKHFREILILQVEVSIYGGDDPYLNPAWWRDATVEDITQFDLEFPKTGELK